MAQSLSSDPTQAIRDAADVSAVTQLVLRERFGRDLGLWEQMRDCFHDDSSVRISWIHGSGPEFVRRSREMAERNVPVSHRLGPILVTLAGERAIAQFGCIVDAPVKVNAVDAMMSSHTRLLLRAERREGTWRLSGFDAVYLRDEMVPLIPGQTVHIDPEALQSYRPSYRLLAYCLGAGGFPVRDDLAGVDRPDLVEALMQEVHAWAGVAPPR